MARFNKTKVALRAKTVNRAGGFSYKRPFEEELVFAVLTTFLEDKFYESGNERIERIVDLVGKCNDQFVAKLAIVARKEFHLRSVTTLLLGELSKKHRGDSLVKDTIISATERVDDLTELASYVGKPIPKQVKRGIRNALFKFNRYQLAKYKGESHEVSLVDLFNLVHPKPQFASDEQRKAWSDLMEGKLKSVDTWESEISATENKKESWEKLILENKLGYMAMLRNLRNLTESGISKKAEDMVINKLIDGEEVLKSKQLPFRFYTAYQNVQGKRAFSDAIAEALDISVSNVPELKGSTLIAVDCSGSMSGKNIEIASIFASSLIKANKDADVILYDTRVVPFNAVTRDSVLSIAEKIQGKAMGGGTETSLVFTQARKAYDRIVILSDNESWNDYGGVQTYYSKYKSDYSCDPFIYAIDIAGYGTSDVKGGRVYHLSGWSEKIFDFIKFVEKGKTLVDYIKDYELPKVEVREARTEKKQPKKDGRKRKISVSPSKTKKRKK